MSRLENSQNIQLKGEQTETWNGVETVEGPSFESLVKVIGDKLTSVELNEGVYTVEFDGDISWHSGAIPSDTHIIRDQARLKLLMRAAVNIASREYHDQETLDGTNSFQTIRDKRQLIGDTFSITHPFPSGNDPNDKMVVRPIKLREALGADPKKLLETAYPPKQRRQWLAASGSALGATAIACTLATPSPPPIEQPIDTESAGSSDPLPAPTYESAPTLPPTPEVFPGTPSNPSVLDEVQGKPLGYGGPEGEIELFKITDEIKDKLNQAGYAPVVYGKDLTQISTQNGYKTCFPNLPEHMYNPDIESEKEEYLGSKDGLIYFGISGGNDLSIEDDIPLTVVMPATSITGLSDDLVCIYAVANREDDPAGEGALRALLIHKDNGDIYGNIPAAFSPQNDVKMGWDGNGPNLTVDGQLVKFQAPVEVVVEPAPEPTPVIVEVEPVPEEEEFVVLAEDDGVPAEVVVSATGEQISVDKGAFQWQNTFIVWDEESQNWEEPIPISTLEELRSQAPSKEEMIEFLQSDTVVRSTEDHKTIIPLGVGSNEVRESRGYYEREIEAVIWDSLKLVNLDLGDGGDPILTEVLPAIIPGGEENLNNPNYVLLCLGKERLKKNVINPSSSGLRMTQSRGTHYLYLLRYEEITKIFIPGRQLGTIIFTGFHDAASEEEYRKMIPENENLRVFFRLEDAFGASTNTALESLRAGGSVDPETLIVGVSNFSLTATTLPEELQPLGQ